MSADPISGIVYPVRSVAPDITATMKPPIDAIGVLVGNLLAATIRRHAEFTAYIAAITNATAWGAGPMTIDAAASTTPAIATGGTHTITVTNAGVYAVDFSGVFSYGVGARSYLDITVGGAVVARPSLTPSENVANASISNLVCAAGTVITFGCFQSGGGANILTSRIRLTRIAA